MKKLITLSLALAFVFPLFAQDSTKTAAPAPASATPAKKKVWKYNPNRANDHFMIQLGYNGWASKPDTINTKGIPRSFNMYFMFDFPFKTSPRFSVGVGAGIGTDNFYLDKMTVDIAGRSSNTLAFKSVDSGYFKKYKIATTYLELPVELRFAADPDNTNKSWKVAIGGKVGTMLSAMTKGKNLQSKSGTVNSYTEKIKSKRYFNSTRLAVTGRVSKGVFGVFGSYQINQFIKDGAAGAGSPLVDIRPFTIGLVISGL
ncbi:MULTISPECIES: outer membrane beta-barrel protein [Niastella]|uniref:Outer membrane beta-barrel protein n=1 Tax=Niastella soli TaxID=2821487 RepID=A0ABS3YNQ0_9BACT|nr:outer membrane beta-barrel protein [Niastella soli]MBO9199522.1 outer membrane beta-barrel protein [Niastella soli]